MGRIVDVIPASEHSTLAAPGSMFYSPPGTHLSSRFRQYLNYPLALSSLTNITGGVFGMRIDPTFIYVPR